MRTLEGDGWASFGFSAQNAEIMGFILRKRPWSSSSSPQRQQQAHPKYVSGFATGKLDHGQVLWIGRQILKAIGRYDDGIAHPRAELARHG